MSNKFFLRLIRLCSIISQFIFLVIESIAKKKIYSLHQAIVGIRATNKLSELGNLTFNTLYNSEQKLMATSFLEYEKGNYNRAASLWIESANTKKEGLRKIDFNNPNVKLLGAGFNQIGHLAGGLGTRAMLKNLSLTDDNYIYLCNGKTNSFYANLFGEYFPIINLQPHELSIIDSSLWPIKEHVYTVETKIGKMDFLEAHNYALKEFNLRDTNYPLLQLPAEEVKLGWEFLKNYGIKENSWFITLHVRENSSDLNSKFYARNADPLTYLPMIDLINSLGGFVIRIGNKSMTALPKVPGLIDLTREKTSEVIDIFALSQCRFMVGTNSGPSAVPSTFGIPVLITNAVPFGKIAFFPNSLSIPKFITTNSKNSITFSQILDTALGGLDSYLLNWEGFKPGTSWRDNTPDEILHGALEMLDSNVFTLTRDQTNIINRIVPNYTNGTTPVSKYFISKHSHLFEGMLN